LPIVKAVNVFVALFHIFSLNHLYFQNVLPYYLQIYHTRLHPNSSYSIFKIIFPRYFTVHESCS